MLRNSKSDDWCSLNNKFSGERFFKYNFFSIVTGAYSLSKGSKNRWFVEEILKNASEGDVSLLSIIKNIVTNPAFDEGVRQRASGIVENADKDGFLEIEGRTADLYDKHDIIQSAKIILSGTRTPQTAVILRLLKEKREEAKRLGLFLIGKFRIASMIPEVCEYLSVTGLQVYASDVLLEFGEEAHNELIEFFFKNSGNVQLCRNILRLLNKNKSERNHSFCFELLWSASRKIKEDAVVYLKDSGIILSSEDNKRLSFLLLKTAGIMTRLLALKLCLLKNDQSRLKDVIEQEYKRWREFYAGIVAFDHFAPYLQGDENSKSVFEGFSEKQLNSISHIILGPAGKFTGKFMSGSDKVKLRKMQRYFPVEIPDMEKLNDYIINSDYNTISIWTKACILHNMDKITGQFLTDSVIALFFSPEEVLQEEAFRLILRSGNKNYGSIMKRVDKNSVNKFNRIISQDIVQHGMIFEKTLFLSSLFTGIYQEDLLFLAARMIYKKDLIPSDTEKKCLIWNCPAKDSDVEVVVVNNGDNETLFNKISVCVNDGFYILALEAVEAFHCLCPEKTFELFKYIDEHER